MVRFVVSALVALQLHVACVAAIALPWLVTEYIEMRISTVITATTYTRLTMTESGLIRTELVTVIPTVTSVSPLSVVTTVNKIYTDLTLVNILVPTGIGTSVDRYPDTTTDFYINLIYTAPTGCKPGWTYTKTANINPPGRVTLPATSVDILVSIPTAFGATTTDYIGWVNPTEIPANKLSSLNSVYRPPFSDSCTIPDYYLTTTGFSGTRTGASSATSTARSGSSSSSASKDYEDRSDCIPFIWYFAGSEIGRGYICDDGTHYTQGMPMPIFIVVWIFTWLGVFLILGLIESYVNFSNLARGRKARRGMPCLFAGLLPFLSCFCLCFRRPGYTAKSADEQAVLTAQWKSTKPLTRIKRWLIWGFRFKYPPFLGDAPTRRKNWSDKGNAANVPPPQYTEARQVVGDNHGEQPAELKGTGLEGPPQEVSVTPVPQPYYQPPPAPQATYNPVPPAELR